MENFYWGFTIPVECPHCHYMFLKVISELGAVDRLICKKCRLPMNSKSPQIAATLTTLAGQVALLRESFPASS